jgi:hypothetical protein
LVAGAPLVGEYLLGNVSIVEIWALPVLALLYGSGAILIREVARRTGRGWPTMLVLGLAYGLIEAGLIDQTLFKPPELTPGVVGAATYVPALGISVSDLLSFVVGHAGWSIGVPIAMVEALVPTRRTTPWLGRAGLAVTGALYLLGAVLVFRFMQQDSGGFLAPAPKLAAVAVASAALIGLAFALGRRPRPPIDRPAPRLWLVAAVALAASFLFGWRGETWSGVAFGVVVAAATAALVARWSRRRGWGAAHRLALAGPALLHQAATGFLLTQLYGREGAIHVIGNVVFAVGAVALFLTAVRRTHRFTSGRPRPRKHPTALPQDLDEQDPRVDDPNAQEQEDRRQQPVQSAAAARKQADPAAITGSVASCAATAFTTIGCS